jgi:hypothetical protein
MRLLLVSAILAGLVLATPPIKGAQAPASKTISATNSQSWKYVADSADGKTLRPLFRTIRLSSVPPAGIRETAAYRGRLRLYGEIHFGSENSEPVLLVLDWVDESECDLYVDANRNRVIETKDKVSRAAVRQSALKTQAGRRSVCEWVVPLAVQIVQHDVAKLSPRTVLVRWCGSPEAVSVATVGYYAGSVELGGRTVKARRVDGDANGLFADPDDRLWIDVNGDGAWDDLAEQFPMIPSIQIAGRRYAVRGDRLGEHLRLDVVAGEGRVRLQPAGLATATKVRQIACMLVGEDGIGFTLAGSEPVAVPSGRYSIDTLSLTVEDANHRSWSYLFSRDLGTAAPCTVIVEKDREVAVDPLGRLRLSFQNEYKVTQAQAGQTLCYRPMLLTSHGLNTNFCLLVDDHSDRESDRTAAHFRLQSLAGQVLDRAESHYRCGALCDFAVTVPPGIHARELKLDGDVDLGPVAGKVTAASLIPLAANRP